MDKTEAIRASLRDRVRALRPTRFLAAAPATEGPHRWAELHRRALAWESDRLAPQSEIDFITHLADGLGGCACRRDWADLLELIPPDLSSAQAYYAWSVAAHNAVNVRLGKPMWP